jgi:hypothetical protein
LLYNQSQQLKIATAGFQETTASATAASAMKLYNQIQQLGIGTSEFQETVASATAAAATMVITSI